MKKLEGQELNAAKKVLANECTRLAHGAEAAARAAETARKTFEMGQTAADLPTLEIEASRLDDGIPAFLLFAEAGLCKSNSEARKLIKGGGAKLNNVKIDTDTFVVNSDDLSEEGHLKISAGKKRHYLVRPT